MQVTARASQHLTVRDVLSRLNGTKKSGNGWVALCPAHDDKQKSFSITEGDGGRVLLYCHAGCNLNQICTALAIDSRSLGPDVAFRSAAKNSEPRTVDAIYDYLDENRNLVFQVLRYHPKGFSQRRPNGKGGWAWNLDGIRRVLYRLPELLDTDPSVTVFVVEGEKDADKLASLGFSSTTNAGGAGKWKDEHSEQLRGRPVCIVPDNDKPGSKHAEKVAASLHGVAASVRLRLLPNLPKKGDGSDWLAAGHTADDLRALVEASEPFELAEAYGPAAEQNESDEEMLQRLADVPPLEYERERLSAARVLKCRPPVLDKLVASRRPKTEGLQGREINLPDIEPWPEPVNGAEVFDAVAATFLRYLVLPLGAADALALWAAHAHTFNAFDVSPRLNFSSPEKGCGKTTARDVLGLFVPRPLATENLSVAVLFRIAESHKPTILADEYDAWLSDNEELRGLFNAGHRRGGCAYRCEGDGHEVRRFGVFTPAVLCGIGALPGTLDDRSIKIRLERAKPGELRKRFDSRHTEREQELCRKLARWCQDNSERIAACDPALPKGAYNRIADNWRPLFAIAQMARGDWLRRANEAFTKLSRAETDEQGLGVMLLSDIRQVFREANGERMFSKTLVDELVAMSDRPWPEARRDKPITESWLARRLRPFGVLPKSIRIEEGNAKGYEISAFQDAFSRYLPDQGIYNRHSVTEPINIDEIEKPNRHNEKACDALKTHKEPINIGLWQSDGLKPPDWATNADRRRHRYIPLFSEPWRQQVWDSWEAPRTELDHEAQTKVEEKVTFSS